MIIVVIIFEHIFRYFANNNLHPPRKSPRIRRQHKRGIMITAHSNITKRRIGTGLLLNALGNRIRETLTFRVHLVTPIMDCEFVGREVLEVRMSFYVVTTAAAQRCRSRHDTSDRRFVRFRGNCRPFGARESTFELHVPCNARE